MTTLFFQDRTLDWPTLYGQSCLVMQAAVPTTKEEAEEWAQRCVAGAKAKAELFGKAQRVELRHNLCLAAVAVMLGFSDWATLRAYATSFATLTPAQRAANPHSVGLAAAAWLLVETDKATPVVALVLAHQKAVLEEMINPARTPAEAWVPANYLLDRIAFKRTRAVNFKEEAREALESTYGASPALLLAAILQLHLEVAGEARPWPALAVLTIRQLLEATVRVPGVSSVGLISALGFAEARLLQMLDGRGELDVLSVARQEQMFSRGAEAAAASQLAEQRAYAHALYGSVEARRACRLLINSFFEGRLDDSVLSALMRPRAASGFFMDLYQGPPEGIAHAWAEAYSLRVTEEEIKPLVLRQILGSHQMSVFRFRRYSEYAEEKVYEIEAVLHDARDVLVAKVGLVAAYAPEDEEGVPGERLAWMLDGTDEDDLREAGLGLAAHYAGHWDAADYLSRVLIVRDWEVVPEAQHQGLGRALLEAAIPLATRGLPRPRVLALRLQPLQFDGATAGTSVGELKQADAALARYWARLTEPGSFLRKRFADIVRYPYNSLCWGDTDVQLLAMGAVRRP